MKKLMIIVTFGIACVANAFAGCDLISCSYAYRLKMSGKTIKGLEVSAKSPCETSSCWAKKCSMRVAGYIYGTTDGSECGGCECIDWTSGSSCHFWDSNKKQVFGDVTSLGFDLFEVLRSDGSKNKVQIMFKIGNLTFSGIGTYNPNTKRLTSASGFYAGTIDPATCVDANGSACGEPETSTVANVFDPCSGEVAESTASAAWGRWMLTNVPSKEQEINKTGKTDCLYPIGFVPSVK